MLTGRLAIPALLVASLMAPAASARSYDEIKQSGTLVLCAHPNSLPFASKNGARHGFQVELAAALAKRLGLTLTREWVITGYDMFRAPCDVVMDSIADPQAQEDSGLKLSKPYRRSGVALAVRADDRSIQSLADLNGGRKVGVLTASIAAMTLDQRGIETLPGLFEDEMLDLLEKREVDAAAVTASSVGYYNLRHPQHPVRMIQVFEGEADLSWNVAVGLRRPDTALTQAVDEAMAKLVADGTAKRIYARYGVTLQPPR